MLVEIAKGLAFTLKTMLRKPITVQWPEEQKPTAPRHRGRHILHRYDNGFQRESAVSRVAAARPVGCIYVGFGGERSCPPCLARRAVCREVRDQPMRCIYCGYCGGGVPHRGDHARSPLRDGRLPSRAHGGHRWRSS